MSENGPGTEAANFKIQRAPQESARASTPVNKETVASVVAGNAGEVSRPERVAGLNLSKRLAMLGMAGIILTDVALGPMPTSAAEASPQGGATASSLELTGP